MPPDLPAKRKTLKRQGPSPSGLSTSGERSGESGANRRVRGASEAGESAISVHYSGVEGATRSLQSFTSSTAMPRIYPGERSLSDTARRVAVLALEAALDAIARLLRARGHPR